MEAVQHFHPEWLVERGRGTFRSLEADPLRVYLDATQLGGTESLNQIQAIEIEYIRFFDTREATLKWGTGHGHGAILVVTVRREG